MTEPKQLLPIAALIEERRHALGLTDVELVRRLGFNKIAKGLQRLEGLCNGNFNRKEVWLRNLPAALAVTQERVDLAFSETYQALYDEDMAAWSASFVPHAIILTERRIPSQITIVGLLGTDRFLRISFDLDAGAETFQEQALHAFRERFASFGGKVIPFFGAPTGLMVNYSPYHAVQLDLAGNPVQIFDSAYRLGYTRLSIKGRQLSGDEVTAIVGKG